MFLVSPFLKSFAYPVLSKANLFTVWRDNNTKEPLSVLTYHGVLPPAYSVIDSLLDGNLVSLDELRRQLRIRKSRYNVITPAQFYRSLHKLSDLPARSMLITCDDALLNVLTDMLPILRELDLQCIFFATGASCEQAPQMLWYEELWLMLYGASGEHIDFQHTAASLSDIPADRLQRQAVWWGLVRQLSQQTISVRREFILQLSQTLGLAANWKQEKLKEPGFRHRFQLMNASQLCELVDAGMTVGAHTVSHPVLSMCSAELAHHEIAGSSAMLERSLGKRVSFFAFPFGGPADVSARDIELARTAGFDCSFLNASARADAVSSLYAIPRSHITADMQISEFEAHASGFHSYLQQRLGR